MNFCCIFALNNTNALFREMCDMFSMGYRSFLFEICNMTVF